ncbi:katanin p80 WD40 repeat-containing subunit B1 homolog KTN80.3-like [Mercurialis annua]|uniref:katanin p80 WD40 repeat-containing subunit B1 homolog KTN80.3-like n=1 Tax=Mercurialis annua TaxID=3986 RepID=UPI00215FAE11|nr:katanin p80 WD40 repeat-containing subunit B1 homolog KTN80.3-like [Mercurialis annua]XP_050204168.1 katanin p80 WD40 repeat-containing subunit B1 homolog KTN80.3-like [Mercurialis annua]
MTKRGYKLQEFAAHSTNVNCLSIGKKSSRMLVTGGDDCKVNLWAIGNPSSLMSLSGHTSPIESLAFDSAEVLVLGGASTGMIKLWDLEEAKVVRSLTGHRSNCTAVEFHPFGEFFASGSADTNLKIWDIRKKGTIHTYKGHTRGVSTIRFSPDGRWVVSGGFDNAVKVWDLTAGKLLHDFKFHEGHIRSLDFHPLEFLLATGSADRTVKFWDLETFELIGSTRPEATGVRATTFHPDGRTFFCGLDDSLKVYSWEPVICHDAIDIGWSTLGDLCIQEGKLLGCSYYRNSVAVWAADISLIEPYGAGFVSKESDSDKKFSNPKSDSPDKVRSGLRLTSVMRSMSPDYDVKEIKNIYIDSTGGKPVSSQNVGALTSSKNVHPLDSKEMRNPPSEKKIPVIEVNAKAVGDPFNKSFVAPAFVPQDRVIEKNSNSGREKVTFSRTKPGMLLRPAHMRRLSSSKSDVDKLSAALESETFCDAPSEEEGAMILKVQTPNLEEEEKKICEEKSYNINKVTNKIEKTLSPETPSSQENVNCSSGVPSVKIVNGVAVVSGRTRSLVERFEGRERFNSEDQSATAESHTVDETSSTLAISNNITPLSTPEARDSPIVTPIISETKTKPNIETNSTPHVLPNTNRIPIRATAVTPQVIREMDRTPVAAAVTPHVIPEIDRTPAAATAVTRRVIPETDRRPVAAANGTPKAIPERERKTVASNGATRALPARERPPSPATNMTLRQRPPSPASNMTLRERPPSPATNMTRRVAPERDRTPPITEEPQVSGRDPISFNYNDIGEELLQTHDVLLVTLKSRLTKIQVVRHFWDQNDSKGAINALRKLRDHSVQADVISILTEKMEIHTLDLFSCILPVLVGLLDSKMERHISVSLEMLLKLVAVFGPVIRSTVSGPPGVGVNLQAEQRLECCKQCFVHLQMIQQILPEIIRKGGVLARLALELNLVLRES